MSVYSNDLTCSSSNEDSGFSDYAFDFGDFLQGDDNKAYYSSDTAEGTVSVVERESFSEVSAKMIKIIEPDDNGKMLLMFPKCFIAPSSMPSSTSSEKYR
mgnify:CR=1 FL=1